MSEHQSEERDQIDRLADSLVGLLRKQGDTVSGWPLIQHHVSRLDEKIVRANSKAEIDRLLDRRLKFMD